MRVDFVKMVEVELVNVNDSAKPLKIDLLRKKNGFVQSWNIC